MALALRFAAHCRPWVKPFGWNAMTLFPKSTRICWTALRCRTLHPLLFVQWMWRIPACLGNDLSAYSDQIDLCIDHHGSNIQYSRYLLLDAGCAATAMLICDVIRQLGVKLDTPMAECIYTALATDTGCFKYSNTTPYTHRMAADMMELNIRHDMINRTMFDVKSRARVELERMALDNMSFYYDGRCAIMIITNDMILTSAAGENDMEGLAPIPRQIEGVWVGVTMRQKADSNFKVSVRTGTHADASAICARLGGGGHVRAAGCTLDGSAEDAVKQILDIVGQAVPGIQGT